MIFVHIPKTAGTSISEYLYEEPMKGHIPYQDYFIKIERGLNKASSLHLQGNQKNVLNLDTTTI